jgi:methylisocitrate lyase
MTIEPASLLRLAMGVAEKALDTFNSAGTPAALVPHTQTRTRPYDMLDYA